jgi:hypothetical protein
MPGARHPRKAVSFNRWPNRTDASSERLDEEHAVCTVEVAEGLVGVGA